MTQPLLDETHRESLTSWVASAQAAHTDFPIQNLPLGIFCSPGRSARPGVAIGDRILDLVAAAEQGLFDDVLSATIHECEREGSLNALLAEGRHALANLRAVVSSL
ncbi:MAG: fumarylacetoacetase, partial [bacterium]